MWETDRKILRLMTDEEQAEAAHGEKPGGAL